MNQNIENKFVHTGLVQKKKKNVFNLAYLVGNRFK